jgi:hypothetical protein
MLIITFIRALLEYLITKYTLIDFRRPKTFCQLYWLQDKFDK